MFEAGGGLAPPPSFKEGVGEWCPGFYGKMETPFPAFEVADFWFPLLTGQGRTGALATACRRVVYASKMGKIFRQNKGVQ